MRASLVVLVGGTACYAPSPAQNVPCGPNGECPRGQKCDVTGQCRSEPAATPDAETPFDAPAADAPIDVPFGFTPSNGVDPSALAGVTSAIGGGLAILVETDTGRITVGGLTVRAAGQGLVDGIRYEQRPTLGVFAATELDVGAIETVLAVGTRGLIVFVAGDARIAGTVVISAGACLDGTSDPSCAGPGGGRGGITTTAALGCGPGGRGVANGDTGGGGGGMGQSGAPGGAETDEMMMPGGVGGAASGCPPASLEPLAGGSGGASSGGAGGDGGGGGGAIQITARGSIDVAGLIVAAGGGGGAGGSTGGGGGGGAGGAILIEAPSVAVSGTLAANGGGGGEGHGGAAGKNGNPSAACAFGGSGTMDGRAGGNGGCLGTQPTAGAPQINDTGGGGGGAGRIRINATTRDTMGSIVSPAASTGPLQP